MRLKNCIELTVVYSETIFLIVSLTVCVVAGQGKYKRCDSISAQGAPTLGLCIEFPLCPRLLEFAKSPRKTNDDFRKLRQLTCGFNRDEPRICCPEEDIYLPPKRDNKEYVRLDFPKNEANLTESTSMEDVGRSSNAISGSPGISYSTGSRERLIPRLEDCGEPRFHTITTTRVIGGVPAEPGQFPYIALLYRIDTETDEEEYYCAGTIINQYYILTAAHCVLTNENSTTQLAFILVGITDVSERCHKGNQRECINERRYEVRETVVHPKYVYGIRDKTNDIALVRTVLPIELNNDYIRPVCLPIPQVYGIPFESLLQENKEGMRTGPIGAGLVAGWGREKNSGPQSTPNLKSVILPILSRMECQSRYGFQVKISENQLCAGGNAGKDTCVGDSGGPLLTPLMPENVKNKEEFIGKMFQTGIISYGPALCAIGGKPSVYTRVISYIDWILDNMYL